jgi:putative peptidoglycan lipid II flippase
MSTLSWAQRLYQFPLGVFGIAVATAIYPLLAKQNKDEHLFTTTLHRGLRLVVFIGLPASAGLILVRDPLVATVFQGVNFTSDDAIKVGAILLGYAPAVWAYSMTQVLTKGFYAKEDAMTPVKVAMCCVVLNFFLNMTLIWTPLGTAGLAWSTACCAVVQVSILMMLIRKHVKVTVDRAVLRSWFSTAMLTIVMGSCVAYVTSVTWDSEGSWLQSFTTLCMTVGTGIFVMVLGSILIRRPELLWVLGKQR